MTGIALHARVCVLAIVGAMLVCVCRILGPCKALDVGALAHSSALKFKPRKQSN